MEIAPLHRWDLTPTEAIALQRQLASRVDVMHAVTNVDLVAGCDVSYNRFSPIFYAAIVVLRKDGTIVETVNAIGESRFPYIPGLLSFREAPILLEAFVKLEHRPDVVMCDGQGIAHPRRFGIASHLGLWLGIPTIGCGKSRLCGTFTDLGMEPGDTTFLRDHEETIGSVVRTKKRCNPIFVSPGHRIDLASSVRIVLEMTLGYRIPEPTRRAHLAVNELRRSQS